MIVIRTLSNVSEEDLLHVFNESFSDYIVPFSLSIAQLKEKLKSDRVNLDLSVGAYDNNRLVGFIIHGSDTIQNIRIAYNAGTGVIPTYRGQRLTKKMYEYLYPFFKANKIEKVKLEVISSNIPAIKTYEHLGFKTIIYYNCYKGTLTSKTQNQNSNIQTLDAYDWPLFTSFWDIQPSWQNSIQAVEKLKSTNISIAYYQSNQPIGYCIFNPNTNRIQQIAVQKEYRGNNVAQQMIQYLMNKTNELTVINVDSRSESTHYFLKSLGLQTYIQQYEMELIV